MAEGVGGRGYSPHDEEEAENKQKGTTNKIHFESGPGIFLLQPGPTYESVHLLPKYLPLPGDQSTNR